MTQEELKTALELHKKWLCSDVDGVMLDFSCMDLSGMDLSGMDLSGADFSSADFSSADLSDANLSGANLSWVNTNETIGIDVICVQLNTSNQNRQIQYYVQLRKATAGCFSGTLDELKKAVREKHDINSVIYKRYQIAVKTIEDILETY